MSDVTMQLRVRILGNAALVLLAAALPLLASCRGGVSKQPPVHLVLDMDFQPKLRAQAESPFWADGMAMRPAPAGTVARGTLERAELRHYKDVAADGKVTWVTASPLPATAERLARGRERYDIHCSPCHDRTGSGQGLVGKRWPTPQGVPTFYKDARWDPKDDRSDLPLGRIVGAITDGFGTMPSYAHQITWEDRWAIAHYIRALQYRMNAPR